MRRVVVCAVAVAGLVSGAAPGGAAPPPGDATTCPGRYQAMTLPQILAQAESYGIPEQRARDMFTRVNKNGDSWICQDELPGEPPSYNFIDNGALGR